MTLPSQDSEGQFPGVRSTTQALALHRRKARLSRVPARRELPMSHILVKRGSFTQGQLMRSQGQSFLLGGYLLRMASRDLVVAEVSDDVLREALVAVFLQHLPTQLCHLWPKGNNHHPARLVAVRVRPKTVCSAVVCLCFQLSHHLMFG
jgi:hypothetical protein